MRLATLVMTLLVGLQFMEPSNAGEVAVWIGMSKPTRGEKEGIYRATLDTEKGVLTPPELAAEIGTPEFLAIHPNGKRLYAACKMPDDKPGVAAFEISDDKKTLRLLNTEPIDDGGACHLATDRSGRFLFTAQYGTGSVAVFPLERDGRIKPRSALVKHSGKGPNKARQEAPHPHWVGTDQQNIYLFVPDLGIDKVIIYTMDLEAGTITPHGHGNCPPGSGPRHFVFHPNGKFAYVVNELDVTVTAFEYDAKAGTLEEIQTIESLPQKMRGPQDSGAEICIRSDGKYLYASTRGHDSVSAFRVDADTGKLTFIEREPIRGAHPRNCELEPSGNWLLAAGRDTNTVAVFRIDPMTGELIYNNKVVNSPAPICVVMQPIE